MLILVSDYDKQYEFRIAAKSAAAASSSPQSASTGDIFGQEAVYRISTHTSKWKTQQQTKKKSNFLFKH